MNLPRFIALSFQLLPFMGLVGCGKYIRPILKYFGRRGKLLDKNTESGLIDHANRGCMLIKSVKVRVNNYLRAEVCSSVSLGHFHR